MYTSQPLEAGDTYLLEQTMKAIDAGNQVIFASNYPVAGYGCAFGHLGSRISQRKAKRNILGGNARKLFKLTYQENISA